MRKYHRRRTNIREGLRRYPRTKVESLIQEGRNLSQIRIMSEEGNIKTVGQGQENARIIIATISIMIKLQRVERKNRVINNLIKMKETIETTEEGQDMIRDLLL